MRTNVLDPIAPEFRTLIAEELQRRNPTLLAELLSSQRPTHEQSQAVVDLLIDAMSHTYGRGHNPDERGRAIDNAIGQYLMAWPMIPSTG